MNSSLAEGALTVPVWRAYPLAEAGTAHSDLDAGRNHGKIILLP
jgi:NADPH:quinone reductase-like Zn-dependent oxidoreductase